MKTNFTQYKTKQDFLKDFPIKNGVLDLSIKNINDDDLKHILQLIGDETKLQDLSLHNNQITTIPESLGELTQLQYLSLNNNQITTIPKSLQSTLPNCNIVKDDECVFIDDVASNQETPVIANSNVIDVLNAKVQDIDNEIAKLQSDKECIQNTIKIMENN